MNLNFYLEKLHNSEQFKEFVKENSDAYLCSGFFVIDKEGGDNKQHFDYYVPSSKKMFSFRLENKCEKVPIELFDDKVSEKITFEKDFDLKDIERMISSEMEKNEIKNKIQKMLFSLQKVDGKNMLVGTIFISSLGMVKVNLDLESMKIIQFEKKSFFDILKRVK